MRRSHRSRLFILALFILFILALPQIVVAWLPCPQEEDGAIGRCPDRATCCPSTSAPEGFSCIPAKAQDPVSARRGYCCDDDDNGGGDTGCGYGYQCAIDANGKPYCKLQKDPPTYVYNNTSRYISCAGFHWRCKRRWDSPWGDTTGKF